MEIILNKLLLTINFFDFGLRNSREITIKGYLVGMDINSKSFKAIVI